MRKIFIFILFCFILTEGYAQPRYRQYNYYTTGVKMSYEMCNFNELNTVNANLIEKPGFTFGATGGYYLTYLFEIHGGFSYSVHDVDVDWLLPIGADPLAVDYSSYKLRYVSVPIQMRLNVITSRRFKLNLGAGLMPEFRLRPKEYVTYVSTGTELTEDIHTTKEFRKVLISAPLTMHMKYNVNRHYAIEIGGGINYYLNKVMPNYLDKTGFSYTFSLAVVYDY